MNQLNTSEEQLRAEVEDLKRQLEQQKQELAEGRGGAAAGPSGRTLMVVVLLLVALAVAGYFLGYAPRQHREQVLAAESRTSSQSLLEVNVAEVKRSGLQTSLVLPGSIEAVTEAPVLARASGYIRKRLVDIGDRVAAGQVLAEIEAPEIEQQIVQAKAQDDQAASAIQQAQANLVQADRQTHRRGRRPGAGGNRGAGNRATDRPGQGPGRPGRFRHPAGAGQPGAGPGQPATGRSHQRPLAKAVRQRRGLAPGKRHLPGPMGRPASQRGRARKSDCRGAQQSGRGPGQPGALE